MKKNGESRNIVNWFLSKCMVFFFLGPFVILAIVKDFHDYLASSSIKKRTEYLSFSNNNTAVLLKQLNTTLVDNYGQDKE